MRDLALVPISRVFALHLRPSKNLQNFRLRLSILTTGPTHRQNGTQASHQEYVDAYIETARSRESAYIVKWCRSVAAARRKGTS
jgi:hypothetical protein